MHILFSSNFAAYTLYKRNKPLEFLGFFGAITEALCNHFSKKPVIMIVQKIEVHFNIIVDLKIVQILKTDDITSHQTGEVTFFYAGFISSPHFSCT